MKRIHHPLSKNDVEDAVMIIGEKLPKTVKELERSLEELELENNERIFISGQLAALNDMSGILRDLCAALSEQRP